MLIHMFVFYVVNKLQKNFSKIISRLQLKSLSSFSVSSYLVSISIYSDLIDLFLFLLVLFIFILPTSVLYICIYFERGKISAHILIEWSVYWASIYFYGKRLYRVQNNASSFVMTNIFANWLVINFPNFKFYLLILWTKNQKLFSSILGFKVIHQQGRNNKPKRCSFTT